MSVHFNEGIGLKDLKECVVNINGEIENIVSIYEKNYENIVKKIWGRGNYSGVHFLLLHDRFLSTNDGTIWNNITHLIQNIRFNSITKWNDKYVLFPGQKNLKVSQDGQVWNDYIMSIEATTFTDLCFTNKGMFFSEPGRLCYSEDYGESSITFNDINQDRRFFQNMSYGNDSLLVTSTRYNSNYDKRLILFDLNTLDYSLIPLSAPFIDGYTILSTCFAFGSFFLFTDQNEHYKLDPITKTLLKINTLESAVSNSIGVIYENNILIVSCGTDFFYTEDGDTWYKSTKDNDQILPVSDANSTRILYYINSKFICVQHIGNVSDTSILQQYYSDNGKHWKVSEDSNINNQNGWIQAGL